MTPRLELLTFSSRTSSEVVLRRKVNSRIFIIVIVVVFVHSYYREVTNPSLLYLEQDISTLIVVFIRGMNNVIEPSPSLLFHPLVDPPLVCLTRKSVIMFLHPGSFLLWSPFPRPSLTSDTKGRSVGVSLCKSPALLRRDSHVNFSSTEENLGYLWSPGRPTQDRSFGGPLFRDSPPSLTLPRPKTIRDP